jgi:dolichyl-diphosphooligosaccharide--protein glycosyltransferase
MASRLQNFDGSMVEPREVVYVEYTVSQSRSVRPIVYRYEVLGIDAARENLAAFTAAPHEGKGAAIGNTGRGDPVETIDALQHYRLIYEQADDSAPSSSGNTHTVKVFEYVRGAKLQGEGRIEVTIETNTGRTFVYTQESKDGLFLLPYATKNSPYPVKTTGPYRLVSSAETIEVSEQEIMEGATITG